MLRGLGLEKDVRYVPRASESVELYGADGEVMVRAERLFA